MKTFCVGRAELKKVETQTKVTANTKKTLCIKEDEDLQPLLMHLLVCRLNI